MILFFLLAGASLHLESLVAVGLLGPAYILLRTAGRLLSSLAAGRMSGAPPAWGRWMGPALLPQAGVAIGMALVALDRVPDISDTILPIMIGSTVVFELVGPVLTRRALVRLGEAGHSTGHADPAV